jgi:hypothetical protein
MLDDERISLNSLHRLPSVEMYGDDAVMLTFLVPADGDGSAELMLAVCLLTSKWQYLSSMS